MTKLFAALDIDGEIRFVGDVPRGAACACFCPECRSPLVARLGDEREWHFAHEGGQERPECEVGAANMLRRLAIEHLRARPKLEFPPYAEMATAQARRGPLSERVEWPVQLARAPSWLSLGAKSAAVARGELGSEVAFELFVDISNDPSKFSPAASEGSAIVIFWCFVPAVADLRRRVDAERHIEAHGRFAWAHHPDTHGLIEATRRRLRDKAAGMDQEDDRERQQRAAAWDRAFNRSGGTGAEGAGRSAGGDGAPATRAASAVGADERTWPWAPQRKGNTSFIFYRMKSGEAWVVYTLEDGNSAIAAWPTSEEGWDEALPASVGKPDRELGVYRARDLSAAMLFLGPRSSAMRASTDPTEFEGH
jgi:hypothetical protein